MSPIQAKAVSFSSRDPLPVLTGLRFLAAASVLIGHGMGVFLAPAEAPLNAIYWLRQLSGVGMTLFFVLSGFVIHYNYSLLITRGGAGGAASFLWARFARLYPLFLAMLLVTILLSRRFHDLLAGDPAGFAGLIRALPFFLLSIHSWIYVPIDGVSLISGIGGGSPITWSISTEWFFYLSYLVLAFAVVRVRRPFSALAATLAWCLLWAAVASRLWEVTPSIDAWAAARFGVAASLAHDPEESFVRWLLYFSPYLRIGEFVLGCLTAQLFLMLRQHRVGPSEARLGAAVQVLAVASIPAVLYLMYAPDPPVTLFRHLNMNFGLAPSLAAIIFVLARYEGAPARLLAWRPLIALGDASYSIYLIHDLAFFAVARVQARLMPGVLSNVVLGWTEFVVVSIGVLIVARATYVYFEWPMRRWLRRLWVVPAGCTVPAA